MAGDSPESHGDLTKSVMSMVAKGGYIGGGMASRDLRERHLVEAVVFVIGGQVCEKRSSRVQLHEFCDSVLS